jgi:uncharacterized protein
MVIPHTVTERIRQLNPWLFGGPPVGAAGVSAPPPAWLPRHQIGIDSFQDTRRAHLIVGPRQAGKSSLIWSALRERERPLYLNMEEVTLRTWCRSPAAFIAELSELASEPLDAVFLEEAQHLDDAALFIKGIIDQRPVFPVLVSGSSSFHLGEGVRESLAGRAHRRVLYPFSLGEVVPSDTGQPRAVFELERREALSRQLRVGGYPEPWLLDDPDVALQDLLQAFVLRDASDLYRIDRLDVFQRVLALAAGQVGDLVNVSEFAALSGASAHTVSRYLSLMEEAHVVRLIPPFAGGKRREVTGARKAFFVDNGLRNAVLGRTRQTAEDSPERGRLVENWVFSELLKGLPWIQPIRYWRSLSGAEVDFVIEGPRGLLGVEVKGSALHRPRLTRSSRSFIQAYQPEAFWVLNDTLSHEEDLGTTRVMWCPLHALPEAIRSWQRRPGGLG